MGEFECTERVGVRDVPNRGATQLAQAKPLQQTLPSGCASTSALDKLGANPRWLSPEVKSPSGALGQVFGRSTLRRPSLPHKSRVTQVAKRRFSIHEGMRTRQKDPEWDRPKTSGFGGTPSTPNAAMSSHESGLPDNQGMTEVTSTP